MSYARFGLDGSSVYIIDCDFGSTGPDLAEIGVIVLACWNCALLNEGSRSWAYSTPYRAAMLKHIADHRAAGHHVPDWVDEGIRDDWTDDEVRPVVSGGVKEPRPGPGLGSGLHRARAQV